MWISDEYLESLLRNKKTVLEFLRNAVKDYDDRIYTDTEVGEINRVILFGNILEGCGLKITPSVAKEILIANQDRLEREIKQLEDEINKKK